MEFYKLENELESSDESGEDERDNEDTTEDESDDWKEHITMSEPTHWPILFPEYSCWL